MRQIPRGQQRDEQTNIENDTANGAEQSGNHHLVILATWSSGPGQAPTCIHLSLPRGQGCTFLNYCTNLKSKHLPDSPHPRAGRAGLTAPPAGAGENCLCPHLGGDKLPIPFPDPLASSFHICQACSPSRPLYLLFPPPGGEGNSTPLLPSKSHGRRSLVGCSPWGRTVGRD